MVPSAVQAEFNRLSASGGRFAALRLPAWIEVRDPQSVPAGIARHGNLHVGESEALVLALELHADAVLIDETTGRAVAIELGLTPVGVFGILVRAKQHGQLAAVAPVVDALLTRARFPCCT
jgi:predicted nucleic acid-binding protein